MGIEAQITLGMLAALVPMVCFIGILLKMKK